MQLLMRQAAREIKTPLPWEEGSGWSRYLEHQTVDLVELRRSRSQVGLLQAVKGRIHKIMHIGQRGLVGLDVDQAGCQPVVGLCFGQDAYGLEAVGRIIILIQDFE